MILFEEKKVAFLFPARNGSTAASKFLRKSKIKYIALENRHIPLKDAKNNFPQIEDYTIYCFFRNPIERVASYITFDLDNVYAKNIIKIFKNDVKGKDYTNFLDVYFKNKVDSYIAGVYFLPQRSYYLNDLNVEVLNFANYESELRRASQGLDLDDIKIERQNQSKYEDSEVNKIEFISWLTPYMKEYFADDCKFMYEKFGYKIE